MDPRAFNPCTCGNAVIAFESDALPGGGATASARCRACGRSTGTVTAHNLSRCEHKVLAIWNKTNPIATKVCPICGRAFARGSKYCCRECARIAHNEARVRANETSPSTKAFGFVELIELRTISQRALEQAREKPRGCSDVRWRIELRRRAKMALLNGKNATAIYDYATPPAEYCR